MIFRTCFIFGFVPRVSPHPIYVVGKAPAPLLRCLRQVPVLAGFGLQQHLVVIFLGNVYSFLIRRHNLKFGPKLNKSDQNPRSFASCAVNLSTSGLLLA